jgi:hypothetical protein
MTSADAARLAALLLQLSDRHPIPALAGSDLDGVEPRLLRSLRARGVLVERADLRDTGDTVICPDGDGGLVEVDPETGEVVRLDDPQSVRHHDIDFAALCREIRKQSGLTGPGPLEIAARIWRLGRHAAEARTAEVCLVRGLRPHRVQETLDRIRGAIAADTPVILVSLSACDLPPSALRQIEGARATLAHAQALPAGYPDQPFAMEFGHVRLPAPRGGPEARLGIDRTGRRALLDGAELAIEHGDFGAFVLLAEEAVDAGGFVSNDRIAAALKAVTGHDSNPEQVDRCVHRLRNAFRKHAGLRDVPRDGYIERRSRIGARLTLPAEAIGFLD